MILMRIPLATIRWATMLQLTRVDENTTADSGLIVSYAANRGASRSR
jgi:hypothetical protein